MHLSWNEIRARAARFAEEWKDAHYERGESQPFYNEFLEVLGLVSALRTFALWLVAEVPIPVSGPFRITEFQRPTGVLALGADKTSLVAVRWAHTRGTPCGYWAGP